MTKGVYMMAPLRDMDNAGFANEVNGTITRSYFGVDPNYKADILVCNWDIMDQSNNTGYNLKFSMGTQGGWYSPDGGKTAKSDKFVLPVKGTVYSGICTWCLEKLDMEDELEKRFIPLERGGIGFLNAQGWTGLSFRYELRKPIDVGLDFRRLDERANRERLWPVKFLGLVTTANDKTVTSTLTVGAKPTEAERKLVSTLSGIARRCNTFTDFIMEAMQLDSLKDYPELLAKVTNPGGFYPEARK